MPKNRKSNKEAKKKPVLTLMEKRAAKKSKEEGTDFLISENSPHGPKPVSGNKRH